MQENHWKKSNTKNAFQCVWCKEIYFNRYNLLQCMKYVHIGFSPFHCDQCNDTFRTSVEQFLIYQNLKVHENAHNCLKSYECDSCGSIFRYKRNLYVHLILYENYQQNKQKCTTCRKIFDVSCFNLLYIPFEEQIYRKKHTYKNTIYYCI